MTTTQVEMKAKCTTCKKVFVVTDAQHAEARDIGCLFSSCCGAVATLERVSVSRSRRKATQP